MRTTRKGRLVGGVALAMLAVLLPTTPAHADVPWGEVEWFESSAPGHLTLAGWVFDRDDPTIPLSIRVLVSGGNGPTAFDDFTLAPSAFPRPDIQAAYPLAGPNQGFVYYNLPLKHSGDVLVAVQAVDLDGSLVTLSPTPSSVHVAPDVTPPGVAITGGPDGTVGQQSVAFAFDSGDAVTTECRWDYTEWKSCSSPATATLGDGGHAFEVRGTDYVGNIDPSPSKRVFTIDTLAPDAAITTTPAQSGSPPRVTIGIASNEPPATLQCSWDDSVWADCTDPATKQLPPGPHRFAVRAIDPAGNVDPIPATTLFKVRPVLSVRVSAVRNGGRLLVGVKPNSAAVNYRFLVQRKKKRKHKTRWVTVRRSKTQGRADTRLLNLPRGKYRVIVPDQGDAFGGTSKAVRLRR